MCTLRTGSCSSTRVYFAGRDFCADAAARWQVGSGNAHIEIAGVGWKRQTSDFQH
jgi:hypothetical protein